jgi:hypothetical protein
MERDTLFSDLHAALNDTGCAICGLVERNLRRYFDILTYERVTDVALRGHIRNARGFCAAHTPMLREARSALGTAIIHADLLRTLGTALAQSAYAPAPLAGRLTQLLGGERRTAPPAATAGLAPQQPCPACLRRAEVEQLYLDVLLAQLATPQLQAAFAASAGLCAPHLRLALRRAPDSATFERLRVAQRLVAELELFIDRHDHRRANEALGAEATSWARATALVAGSPLLGCEDV